MWAAVRSCTSSHVQSSLLTSYPPDIANQFFAKISTAQDYSRSEVMNLRSENSEYDIADINANKIADYEVERMLRLLKNTAPGNDDIPCWVFKSCSYELAGMVADIINSSFLAGVVPSSWLTSIVTPIPKVSNPKDLSDYRPISVTPILSRLTEKLLVQRWLKPLYLRKL
jgi:hypothetical protein